MTTRENALRAHGVYEPGAALKVTHVPMPTGSVYVEVYSDRVVVDVITRMGHTTETKIDEKRGEVRTVVHRLSAVELASDSADRPVPVDPEL